MTDLTEFVRARLDEDAAAAQLAAGTTGGRWTHPDTDTQAGCVMDRSSGLVIVYDEGAPDRDEAAHIARHDPARALAEVASKRALLYAVVSARRDLDHVLARPPADPAVRAVAEAKAQARWSAWAFVLDTLAQPYVDHPDYLEARRP